MRAAAFSIPRPLALIQISCCRFKPDYEAHGVGDLEVVVRFGGAAPPSAISAPFFVPLLGYFETRDAAGARG
jgi:hypothetical protein